MVFAVGDCLCIRLVLSLFDFLFVYLVILASVYFADVFGIVFVCAASCFLLFCGCFALFAYLACCLFCVSIWLLVYVQFEICAAGLVFDLLYIAYAA